ncbi:hypothetical protein F5Y11DRAFT_349000 [Daldinia sp. FL1419]|nr:hypothetical protein F5Y11DRAFT_349000 [Daldinia sp. FL1419]
MGRYIQGERRNVKSFGVQLLTQAPCLGSPGRGASIGKQWEARLDTHDLEIPLPIPSSTPPRVLRAILLLPSDVGKDESRNRIQRLFHRTGGQDIVIVFLLEQEQDQASPMVAFMKLQLEYSSTFVLSTSAMGRPCTTTLTIYSLIDEFEIPIIPASSVQDVSANLMTFHRNISTSNPPKKPTKPVEALLPYCTDEQRPLSAHTVNVLTDLTPGFRDLVEAISTPPGRMKMIEFLGNDAEGIISFWAKEYTVE